jgi:hypothetical protein
VEPVVESVVESEAAPIDDTSSAPVADGSALEVSTDETKTETTED